MIVLDTHVLLWLDQDSPRLGSAARSILASAAVDGALAVSAITFWEVAMLVAKGRVTTTLDLERWRQELLDAGLQELPVDGATGILATRLAPLHDDPADRMILAAAMKSGAGLVTADERLLAWQGDIVRHDARL